MFYAIQRDRGAARVACARVPPRQRGDGAVDAASAPLRENDINEIARTVYDVALALDVERDRDNVTRARYAARDELID